MPRPRKCRMVESHPEAIYFKPRGIPMQGLVEVYLSVDGYEAIRLVDYEGLGVAEAAERMQVSRHILGRLLAEARKIVAEMLVMGRSLRIEGGDYALKSDPAARQDGRRNTQNKATDAQTLRPNKEDGMSQVIAVTSEGPGLDSRVDPRFGRAAGFVVVNLETGENSYVENGASQAMSHGAGIAAAERIAKAGASVLLSGFVGPKAFMALEGAGIRIGQDVDGMTVAEAVDRFKEGKIEISASPKGTPHS